MKKKTTIVPNSYHQEEKVIRESVSETDKSFVIPDIPDPISDTYRSIVYLSPFSVRLLYPFFLPFPLLRRRNAIFSLSKETAQSLPRSGSSTYRRSVLGKNVLALFKQLLQESLDSLDLHAGIIRTVNRRDKTKDPLRSNAKRRNEISRWIYTECRGKTCNSKTIINIIASLIGAFKNIMWVIKISIFVPRFFSSTSNVVRFM